MQTREDRRTGKSKTEKILHVAAKRRDTLFQVFDSLRALVDSTTGGFSHARERASALTVVKVCS